MRVRVVMLALLLPVAAGAATVEELRDRGSEAYQSGDYAAAAELYGRAVALDADGGHPDPALSAWLTSDLAEMNRLLGDYAAAEDLLGRAIAHSRRAAPADPYLAAYLSNLAALLWDLERLDETERILREVRQVAAADPNVTAAVRATIDLNLGVVLRDQERLDEARPLLLAARDAARVAVTDSLVLPYFLSEPARLLAAQGDWNEAERHWREALALVPPRDRGRAIYRAQILLDRVVLRPDRGTSALADLDEIVALRRESYGGDHPETGAALAVRARRRLLFGDTAGAGDDAESALEILADSPAAAVERATARAVRARVRHAGGDTVAALSDMAAAIDAVEFLRHGRGSADVARISFLQDFQSDYETMVAWQVAADSTAAALVTANRLRARVLAERAGLDARRLLDGIPPETLAPLLARRDEATAALNRLERDLAVARSGGGHGAPSAELADRLRGELDAAWRRHQAVEAEIRLHSPAWRRLRQEGPDASLAAALGRLGTDDRLVLVYHVAAAGSFVFALPDGQRPLRAHRLALDPVAAAALGLPVEPTPEVLAALVSGAHEGPAGTDERGVSGVASVSAPRTAAELDPAVRLHALWRYLLPDDLWDRVLAAAEVVVVPSGDLAQLPFDALVVGDGPRYWLDEGPPVRTAPSLSLLVARAGPESPRRAGVLTVNDPRFGERVAPDGSPWAPLPGTRREAAALQASFGDRAVVALDGVHATETAVRAALERAGIIHLATHGQAPAHRPWRSGLILAPERSGRHDGVLHRHEIAALDLHGCELAVLSACHSGAGRPVPAEGVFALAQAFQVAGARATVSALWAVDDQATALLMSEFFAGLAAAHRGGEPVSIASVLHEAKRKVRARPRWSSPRHWAAFVCDGGLSR